MLRPKVLRIIKLQAFKRAFSKSNPFRINDKDRRQLRSWLKPQYKLFIEL